MISGPNSWSATSKGALLARLLNPVNLTRVASPRFGRIDLAAELYDREIFDATASPTRTKRPALGHPQCDQFRGRQAFSTLPKNISTPSARTWNNIRYRAAVAASSAFPFLLTPLSLKNYPLAPGYEPPWWYPGAEESKDWFTRRYTAAKNLDFYKDKHNAYVHLMDGGLADNIGVRALLDAYDHGFIDRKIQQGAIKRLVLIVVNARTQGEDRLSQQASPPGMITVAEKTASIAMDNYSFESIAQLREELYSRVQTQKDLAAYRRLQEKYDPGAPKPPQFKTDIDTYVVEVNFEAAAFIPGEDPRYYLDLPTTFNLDQEQINKLIAIGPKLLPGLPAISVFDQGARSRSRGPARPPECPVGAGIKGN